MKLSEKKTVALEETQEKITFSKAQILQAKKYMNRKDLLNVLLKDDQFYTLDEVDALIDKFMKDKVK